MTDDEVARRIAAFEHAITSEDPCFVHRLDRVARRDAVHALIVGALLAVGAVLLTTGVGTMSSILWTGGLVSLIAAMVVDAAYKRRLRRAR